MNGALLTGAASTIPPKVHEFAAARGVNHYLPGVLDLARRSFPTSSFTVTLGQDAEDDTHQYIAIDIEAGNRTTAELLDGQQLWSTELARICPSRHAVYFVLGWR